MGTTILKQAMAALAALFLLAACGAMPPPRSDAVFAQIHRGMTTEQVREHLGPPDETMRFGATHTVSWSYFYYDTWGFYAEESITFNDAGQVVGTFSKRVGYGGGSGTGGRD
ncbi:MAG TPA: outer membrane protein assembly factor BamE [Usitatibacter sp.]|nr:outer membrane protein assembly factor BamE [Usitatibacter sp.]